MVDHFTEVYGEEDIFISHVSSFQYVEAGKGSLEIDFQALEVTNVLTAYKRTNTKETKTSTTMWKDGNLLPKGGGSNGCEKLWDMAVKKDKHGLG